MSSETALLGKLVRDFMDPPPPVVAPGTGCADAVAAMTAAGRSSLLVGDPAGGIEGIVTEQDVTRRIAFRAGGDSPVSAVMTAPVRTVGADDYLYRAVGTMRRFDLRHMPVIGPDGTVAGMLDLRHALADVGDDAVATVDRLTYEGSPEGLAAAKVAQVEVAAAMLEHGVAAPDIQALISHVNNDIYRRATDDAVNSMTQDGLGEPPVPFAVIVMGSGGRGENFLNPDQDNGFVIADYPDSEHGPIDGYFTELAVRMTGALDDLGFPLCRGGVMATNPLWRKTVSQWRAQTSLWAGRRSIAAVRLADIFFDFSPVWGDAALARTLRDHVTGLMAGNVAFLQAIERDVSDHHSALGFFGRFIVDREAGPFRGWIEVKHGGTLPLINSIRLLALSEPSPASRR